MPLLRPDGLHVRQELRRTIPELSVNNVDVRDCASTILEREGYIVGSRIGSFFKHWILKDQIGTAVPIERNRSCIGKKRIALRSEPTGSPGQNSCGGL